MYETMVLHTEPDAPLILQYARDWLAAEKVVYSTTLESVSSAKTMVERTYDPDAVRKLKADELTIDLKGDIDLRVFLDRHRPRRLRLDHAKIRFISPPRSDVEASTPRSPRPPRWVTPSTPPSHLREPDSTPPDQHGRHFRLTRSAHRAHDAVRATVGGITARPASLGSDQRPSTEKVPVE